MQSPTRKRGFDLQRIARQSWQAILAVVTRFPLTVLSCAGLASLIIYRIAVPYSTYQSYAETLDRLTGLAFLGIFLSLCVSLILERKPRSSGITLGAYVLQAAVLFAYYIFLLPDLDMVSGVRLGMTIAALGLSFIFIPYYFRRKNLETYIVKLISEIAVTVFFSLVLAAGISMILFAIQALLIENLNEDLYAYTWILTATIFAPIHFLSSLPKFRDNMKPKQYSQVIRVVLTYIVLPLLSVYTLVLYAYFARILINWDWPSGIVSYLVSSYAAVGIVSMYLLWPFRDQNRWIRTFISVFTKIIFPLLVMMFIAIFIRINAYGFTERRYFILIIGVWATAVMVFININRGKNNIIFIMSLALTCLLAVYGPLSAFDVSVRSQNGRFEDILERNGVLVAGQLQPAGITYSDDDAADLASILNYFYYNHAFADLKVLPDDFGWDQMEAVLGLADRWPDKPYYDDRFDYYRDLQSISVSGYDLMFQFDHYDFRDSDFSAGPITFEGTDYLIRIDSDNIMRLYAGETELCSADLTVHYRGFYDSYGKLTDPQIKREGRTYELDVTEECPDAELRFVYGNVHGEIEDDEFSYANSHGILLVKLK